MVLLPPPSLRGPLMRLILLGPPGCGKGTQAKLLSRRLDLEHIGTGDLLRAAIRNTTPVGARARPFVDTGNLVPDDLVNELVAERFQRTDRPSRFVMDGYPRTLAQAHAFEQVLAQWKLPVESVILMNVSDAEITRRVTGRWSCPTPNCKATYHVENNPPRVAGVCDECGGRLIQRADDNVDTVRARLKVYHNDTSGLIPYYRQRGLLSEVEGSGSIEQIYASILGILQPQGG